MPKVDVLRRHQGPKSVEAVVECRTTSIHVWSPRVAHCLSLNFKSYRRKQLRCNPVHATYYLYAKYKPRRHCEHRRRTFWSIPMLRSFARNFGTTWTSRILGRCSTTHFERTQAHEVGGNETQVFELAVMNGTDGWMAGIFPINPKGTAYTGRVLKLPTFDWNTFFFPARCMSLESIKVRLS